MKKNYRAITKAIHSGYSPDSTNSSAVPLHRTAAYVFKDTEHAANLFSLKELGNIYTRQTNPTLTALEERVTELEGAAAAVSFASGTAAIQNSIINIAQIGDEIISSNAIYGGTYAMFEYVLPTQGIHTHFVDPTNLDSFKQAINEKTRAIFIESIGNPILSVPDIESIAKLAHDNGLPLIVDGTFTTPFICRSIDYGANIVVNSLTKWYGGHGNAIGGIVIDAGNFTWKDNPRFPLLNEPDLSYHGARWAHDLGELSQIAYAVRLRVVPLRNIGACLAPDNAWIYLQNMETLALRVQRHSSNAQKVAEQLQAHPKIESLQYPGLPNNSAYANATKHFQTQEYGYGGMVVICLKGGREAGEKFISKLSLFSHLANVGDTKSLAIHPASTTHAQLNEEQQKSAGIDPGLVRLSIGIEHIDDVLEDLAQALQ